MTGRRAVAVLGGMVQGRPALLPGPPPGPLAPADGFGQCCGFPVEGYQNGGQSNGTSGGSAISPQVGSVLSSNNVCVWGGAAGGGCLHRV